jgi:hypothetical protein
MMFAKRIFFWAGVYGILTLLPMYFLEERVGHLFPPAINRPETYYAFLGVSLAWQFAFLTIAGDPLRFRPMMLPSIAEKFLAAGAVVWLFLNQRIDSATMSVFMGDFVLGILFIISYMKTAQYGQNPKDAG